MARAAGAQLGRGWLWSRDLPVDELIATLPNDDDHRQLPLTDDAALIDQILAA